ncbi:MAG TPA: hypothetical protein DD426_01880 [Clostridiaceae bacterium]|nr:hypothetical protein [Clostridiaceae bacterium]
MIKVDDKLKLFAKLVLEKVQNESEKKVNDFKRNQDTVLESEKQRLLKESENLIKKTRKKAENKKRQIVSKAVMDRQRALLKKRKEVYDRMVKGIRDMTSEFVDEPEYLGFLEKNIALGFSKFDAKNAVMLVTPHDMEKYYDSIKSYIDKYKKNDMNVEIKKADDSMLGGCIIEDADKTMRVDCSMEMVLEDNRVNIGKTLTDNV